MTPYAKNRSILVSEPGSPTTGDEAVTLTLSPSVAEAARRMGKLMGDVGPAEVVRRGLVVLDLVLSLGESEHLVVHNRDTGGCEDLRFTWRTPDASRSGSRSGP